MGDDRGARKSNDSRAPGATAVSSAPPITDEIDSEWEASPAAFADSMSASAAPGPVSSPGAPVNLDASMSRPLQVSLVSPVFPRDPQLPTRAASEVQVDAHASRAVAPSRRLFAAMALGVLVIGVWLLASQASNDSAAPAKADVGAAAPQPRRDEAAIASTAPLAMENSEASASAAPPASAVPSAAPQKIAVVIRVEPESGRIYYRGKDQGRPPLTVELEPGKKRAFEVGAPGFQTRRLVVDGSKTEISVGLRPVVAER